MSIGRAALVTTFIEEFIHHSPLESSPRSRLNAKGDLPLDHGPLRRMKYISSYLKHRTNQKLDTYRKTAAIALTSINNSGIETISPAR